MTHAEEAYLFKHGLLRDAAYNLQLPGERARLHFCALEILETEPEAEFALAADMADHAREAATLTGKEADALGRELHYLQRAVAHTGRVYESERQVELCRRVAEHPLCEPAVAAEHLATAARALLHLGRALDAEPLVDRALEITSSGRDRLQHLTTRRLQLDVFKLTGRRTQAQAEAPGLVDELRAFGDSSTLASAELDLDDALLANGDHEASLACIMRSMEIARRLGDSRLQAQTLARLGYRKHKDGDSEEAEKLVKQGLDLCRVADDPFAEASLQNALGVIYVETHRIEMARECYTKAMEAAAATGRLHALAIMARNLANIEYYFGGDLRIAARMYRQAQEFFTEGGDLENATTAAQSLGSAMTALGDPAAALKNFEESILLAKSCSDDVLEAIGRRQASAARRALEPGRTEVPELVEVARVCSGARSKRNLEHTLSELAQDLFDKGLHGAVRRVLDMADRLRGSAASGWATPPFEALFGLLSGDTSRFEELIGAQAKIFATPDTPHHHITRVLRCQLRRALAAAAGDTGTRHLHPGWSGMEAAETIFMQMQRLADGHAGQYSAVRKCLEASANAVSELRQAAREQRPAMLFRGHMPDQLQPACRAAFLDRVRTVSPDVYQQLQRDNPPLLQSMQGTPPDWAAEDLPDGALAKLESELTSLDRWSDAG